MRIGVDAVVARNARRRCRSPRAISRSARRACSISASRFAKPSRPSVIISLRRAGQRLGALVDLDAGNGARVVDQLDKRRAVLRVLADGLVVEDDAGDVTLSSPACGTASRDNRGGCPRSNSTPIASKRFLIVPELSSAARMPLPGATILLRDLFQSSAIDMSLSLQCCLPALSRRAALAFEPFEKRAARGRDIGEIVSTPACASAATVSPPPATEMQLAHLGQHRDVARDRIGAGVERRRLEGAERPVPHQRLRRLELRGDRGERVASRRRGSSRRPASCATGSVFAAPRLELLRDDASVGSTIAQSRAFAAARISRAVVEQRRLGSDLPIGALAPQETCSPCAPPMTSMSTLRDQDFRATRAWSKPSRRRRPPRPGARGSRARASAPRAPPASRGRHRRAADARGLRSRHARGARPRRRR